MLNISGYSVQRNPEHTVQGIRDIVYNFFNGFFLFLGWRRRD